MFQRFDGSAPYVSKELMERGIVGEIRPQDDHVGEIAGEPVEFRPATSRGGDADQNLVLAAVALEQHLKRG